MKGYIYEITNNINYKKYVGLTTRTTQERFSEHRRNAVNKENKPLYNAMNKYGIEKFSFNVLEEINCSSKEELLELLNKKEKEYIKQFDSNNSNYGYNLTDGGDVFTFSDEVKIKLGEIKTTLTSSVEIFDLEGNYIDSVNSAAEAKIKYGIISLERLLQEKTFTSNNYVCILKENYSKEKLVEILEKAEEADKFKPKGIFYSKEIKTNLIKEHENITIAAKELFNGRSSSGIAQCLRKEISKLNGFIFSYSLEEIQNLKVGYGLIIDEQEIQERFLSFVEISTFLKEQKSINIDRKFLSQSFKNQSKYKNVQVI